MVCPPQTLISRIGACGFWSATIPSTCSATVPAARPRAGARSCSSPARPGSARPSCCAPSPSRRRCAVAVGHVRLAEHAPPARPAARRRGASSGPTVTARCCAEPRAQHEIFAAVLDALRAASARAGRRGPALGRRGDAGPRAVPRPPDRDAAAAAGAVLPRRRSASTIRCAPVLGDLVAAPDARRLQLTPLSRAAVAALRRRAPARPRRRPPRGRRATRSSSARSSPSRTRRCPRACATPWSPGPPALTPDERRRARAAVVHARTGRRDAARRARRADGDRRGARRHRAARPPRPRRRVPARDRPLGRPRRGRTRLGAGAARDDDRRAGGGRRRTPSVLAHHAAAAGGRPADPAVRAGRGGRGRPVRRAPGGRRVLRARAAPRRATTPAGARRCSRPCPMELYLTDRLDDAIAARTQALELRRELGDVVAVGAGHRALSLFALVRGRPLAPPSGRTRPPSRSSPTPATPARLGYALANRAFLAAQRGDPPRRLQAGQAAQRIADELGDAAVCTPPRRSGSRSPGCTGATCAARADLLAARDVGLRQRLDELATAPMSNLAHLDVEQGRFAEADDILADALRFSEERDIPICTMWQRGVRARLRLLQGRWRGGRAGRAERCCASGDIPTGPAVAAPRARAARRAPRRAAGEPAPRRAVAAGGEARRARHARRGRGGARRAGVDHSAAPTPRLDDTAPRGLVDVPDATGGDRLPPVGAPARRSRGAAGRRRRRPAVAPDLVRPAVRAGAGPVGQRLGRRPAGRTPAARRAGRPRRRRRVPRPAARARGDGVPARPLAGHPRQPGGPHRAPARRAAPCSSRV